MRNAHVRFMCCPSVVEVGKKTTVFVRPRDISREFLEDQEYELGIVGVFDDHPDYHTRLPLDHDFTVKDGCLVFEHTFEKEQEYSIRFCRKGQKEERIPLYAVEADLFARRPLKGDLHTHSYYSDGADGVAMTPADYREEGFDFFFLTDHNRMYTSEYAAKLYEGIPLGVEILRGEEVHTPGSLLHIVHAGGRESVCDRYISDPAGYERELDALEESLSHIDPQYRRRYAMAKWACDRIHEAGGIAILAHPYWRPNANNLANEFIDLLYDEKLFDAFEVLGGIGSVHNNMQLALWHQKCLEGKRLSVVASSDSHDHDSEKGIFARRFTLVFAKENTNEAILQGVREGFSVAGEIPAGDSKEVRFYGDLRLVNFAHFLFQNYFNETWRLCVGEGILMRRYAEGEDVGQMLAALAPTVEDFYKRFYGLVEQQGLPACRRAYLQQLRQIQQTKGPITKGSQLYIYGGNERRE